jgi:hypothetical protein
MLRPSDGQGIGLAVGGQAPEPDTRPGSPSKCKPQPLPAETRSR